MSIWAIVRMKNIFSSPNLIFGWISGIFIFTISPLSLITLNGGIHFRGYSSWSDLNLYDNNFVWPYILTCISLILSMVVVISQTREGKLKFNINNYYDIESKDINQNDKNKLKDIKKIILLLMSCLLITWAIEIWSAGGLFLYILEHWYTRGDYFHEKYGQLFVLYLHLLLIVNIFFVASSGLYTVLIIKHSKFKREIFFFALIVIFFLIGMVLSGNRIHIAVYGIFLITGLYLLKLRKALIIVIVVIFLSAPFFSLWSRIRANITDFSNPIEMYQDNIKESDDKTLTIILEALDGSGVVLSLNVIKDFGNRYSYLDGQSYWRAFTFFVPRSIFPDKPQNFTVVLANLYEPDANTSLGANVIGELFANFGYYGFLIMPMFTYVLINKSIKSIKPKKYYHLKEAIYFVLAIHAMRFGVPVVLVLFVLSEIFYRLFRLKY